MPSAPTDRATGAHPTRRTQAERRATTRRALLAAATASLVEQGHAASTTTVIAKRAGVSQGALFKHFPTKDDLLAATAEHLYDEMTTRYLDRFRRLERRTDGDERVTGAVRLLWQMFESPEFGAALELAVAARTDDALRARLEPVVTLHGERMRTIAAELFPGAAGRPGFALTMDLILEVMLGMAVSRGVDRSTAHCRRLLTHITDLARTAFAPNPSGAGGHLPTDTTTTTDPARPRST